MLRLKELREQNRLNQEGLALKLYVSQSTISAYEIDKRTPDLKTIIAIAKLFHVSIDYLVGLSDVKYNLNSSDLSPEELEHFSRYRLLSALEKEKANSYMDALYSK